MSNIGAGDWSRYKTIIDNAHGMFNQDDLTWIKYINNIPRFNEETTGYGTPINLKVLLGYNYFRTWPLSKHDSQGELDNQNMVVYINRQYLSDAGYLTPDGYFDYRPDRDYFIHRGIRYKAEGDTLLAQAYNDPLLLLLVLRREEIQNGEKPLHQVATQTVIVDAPLTSMVIKTLEPEF